MSELEGDQVVISIDVEWAHPEVLGDVVRLLDERQIPATFFCTHEGIEVPGHERALHPNFRRAGNSIAPAEDVAGLSDADFYHNIVSRTKRFCPEAVGVRSHSLFTDSDLLPIYRDAGVQYDSSYMLPLAPGLALAWMGWGILEIPIYYMDHWDLSERASGFEMSGLRLDNPGLKVVVFHPNLIYLNAASARDPSAIKAHYHDPEWLLEHRGSGRGVRTLFVELLDRVARAGGRPSTLTELNASWRTANYGFDVVEPTAKAAAG